MWGAAQSSWQQSAREGQRGRQSIVLEKGASTATGAETRIGDAERNRARDILTRHFADGRLDPDELEERMEAVTTAKVGSQLQHALRQLPHLETAADRRARRTATFQAVVRATLIVLAFGAYWSLVGIGFFSMLFFFWFALPAVMGALSGGGSHRGRHGPPRHGRYQVV